MDKNNLPQTFENLTIDNELEEIKEGVFADLKILLKEYDDKWNNEEDIADYKRIINKKKTIEEVKKYFEKQKERIIRENTETVSQRLFFQRLEGEYYKFNRTKLGGEIQSVYIHKEHSIWDNLYTPRPENGSHVHYRLVGAKYVKKDGDDAYYEPRYFITSLRVASKLKTRTVSEGRDVLS